MTAQLRDVGVFPGTAAWYQNVRVDERGRIVAVEDIPHNYRGMYNTNDLSYYAADVLRLREENEEIHAQMAKMQSMIDAMWYAPGMPGANEVLEDFEEEKNKNEKE